MKKEIKQVFAGAVVIPIIFLILFGVCYVGVHHKDTTKDPNVETVDYNEETLENLEERDYVRYQNVPQCLVALKDNPAFYHSEYDEESDEMAKESADFKTFLEDEQLINESNAFVVSDCKDFFCASSVLEYDDKKNSFVNKEFVQELEKNGFTGFGNQLEKVEKSIQRKSVTRKKDYFDSDSECYDIICQGVEFELTRTEKGNFEVDVSANYSYCYAPEKYLDFIRQQTASGDYYLVSSCIGQKKDVLTFGKNNCMIDRCAQADEEVQDAKENGKRVSFVFENGTLEDYFVTVVGADLSWDSKDRAFMGTATAGLHKELKRKPKRYESYYQNYRVYFTKA